MKLPVSTSAPAPVSQNTEYSAPAESRLLNLTQGGSSQVSTNASPRPEDGGKQEPFPLAHHRAGRGKLSAPYSKIAGGPQKSPPCHPAEGHAGKR